MAGKIREDRDFIPVRIAVLTVSDTRTFETDKSGQTLADFITNAGHILANRQIIPDDRNEIAAQLRTWIKQENVDVILTTGGTGITGRDVTPEAVRDVIELEIPGFGELFRMLSYAKIGSSTIQSRALAGRTGNTLIFALPGSTGACKDAWNDILQYQLDSRFGPCNFVELMPRFTET
ncbi:molybdenum cofactor biosynthesis protein B [Kordiimonas sediminis]|uniref:Molybdenum cofactor biosynthesis protein B n=1 Tax=Kordiimonas sediminis TaxID=1735581 RepID=A0A919ASF6_9PROT|nr:molybdenum cofactor biosynthesis protein B [Kordiimonas sediminis]GHF20554.1 molybdenum cofactor biosynthesis protein B [Kordiimonas sediminis]